MGIISTLKSILGVGGRTDRESEAAVTVEHDPDASAERAVTESEPDPGPAESTTDAVDEGAGATDVEEPASRAEPRAVEGSDDPVETITGIGPAYADRLSRAGIETVGELAAADAAEVAGRADLSETRVRDWIEQARAE